MQLQASYIIRELKQLLKHRKYKYVLNRIERILEKEEDYQYFCIEFHLNLRILQLAAINRLLERNLIKKYKYSLSIIEFMVEVALRDLGYCHHVLKEKIKEKTIFTKSNNVNGSDNTFTINSHNNSLDEHRPSSAHSRNYSIKINAGLDNQEKLKRFLRKFFEVTNRSVLLIMQTFVIYRFDLQEDALNDYLKNQSEAKFSNISGTISIISVYLFHSKLLFLSQDTNCHIRCEQFLDEAIEKLIDAMHQINISSSKAVVKEGGKATRYQKWREQCQKLIIIALVLNNKVKMKLGKETIALAGIQLFQSYLQGLPPSMKNFRRLMLPELYLQEQFLRYRAEKTELAQIVAPFFWERAKQIEEMNREREFSRHRLMDFYNKKNVKMSERATIKPRAMISELTTTKSLMATTRHKNNLSIQSKVTKERSSYDCKNRIITNMIIADISDINANYLKTAKVSSSKHAPTAIITPNKENPKSYFYKNNTQNALKRQAVSNRTSRHESKEEDNVSYHTQRQKKLYLQEKQYKNYVNRQKDRLSRKKKQFKLQFKQNEMHIHEEMTAIKQNLESHYLASCKYTQQKSIDIEQRDVRRNVVAITSRKKTQMFVQILFHNKDVLGIRKITQKIESLRKKEQEKAKLTTNRLTSSINREQNRGSIFKFQVIAKEIIRKHISFAYDKPAIQRTPSDCLETKRKLIEANYTLGQRSIEAVKEKLQCKLNKSEYPVDKYLKNQEIFKLKLKKLGTTNFILKKNTDEKSVKQPKEAVESVEVDEIIETE